MGKYNQPKIIFLFLIIAVFAFSAVRFSNSKTVVQDQNPIQGQSYLLEIHYAGEKLTINSVDLVQVAPPNDRPIVHSLYISITKGSEVLQRIPFVVPKLENRTDRLAWDKKGDELQSGEVYISIPVYEDADRISVYNEEDELQDEYILPIIPKK